MIAIGNNSSITLKIGTDTVSKAYWGTTQVYPNAVLPYESQYLTIEALSSGTFSLNDSANTFSYSTDGGSTWSNMDSSTSVSLTNGDKMLLKCSNPILTKSTNRWNNYGIGIFGSTCNFKVYGNAMSLLYGDNFQNQTALPTLNNDQSVATAGYQFNSLFKGCTHVYDAQNLILPATTVGLHSYDTVFYGCTNLTTPPALPATTLAEYCYSGMFQDCTSLTTAPELPATTLYNYCYSNMFSGCVLLTTAPELPATTLANSCYNKMFNGCSSLNYIKAMFTTTPSSSYTYNWVYGVAATGTFVKNSSASWDLIGDNGVPTGWVAYPQTRWVTTSTQCVGYDKYADEKEQLNEDGTAWEDTGNTRTRLVEANSEDCGYTPPPYQQQTIKTTALESGTIEFNIPAAVNSSKLASISYSTDNGGTWTERTNTSNDITVSVNVSQGDNVLWRGRGTTLNSDNTSTGTYCTFGGSARFNVSGNIFSLICSDSHYNFSNVTQCTNNFEFANLFAGSYVVDASNLILPATTLTQFCYASMFSGCIYLTAAPTLPATTLTVDCYRYMFNGCTSLVTAPQLPATTMTSYCYQYMFTGCTSLVNAPALNATILDNSCYSYMFQNCTSLTTAPQLPATNLANYCYEYMFYNCSSLTTAPSLPATTLVNNCYSSMFRGCTSLTTAPELPATTLASRCYDHMFYNCLLLTTAPVLPATTLVSNCYRYMFNGCSSLNYIKCLATDISASNCTTNWVQNVAASGTFVKAASMSSWGSGYNGIPSGWTTQDASE